MPYYQVKLVITPNEGMHNPEARTIEDAITNNLGFDIKNLDWGKYGSYIVHKKTKEEVREEVDKLCNDFLANTVIEQYEIFSIKRITKKEYLSKTGKQQMNLKS